MVAGNGCQASSDSSTIGASELLHLCDAFSTKAEAGDPSAMLELSRCYYNGSEPGFARDLDKARRLLEASANLDYGPAKVSLAAFILVNARDDASKNEALTWAQAAKASNQLGAGTLVVLALHGNRGEPLGSDALDQMGADAISGYLPAAFALFAQSFVGAKETNGNTRSLAFEVLQYLFADFGLEDAKGSCSNLASESSILAHAFEPAVLQAAERECLVSLDRVTQEAGSFPLVPRP